MVRLSEVLSKTGYRPFRPTSVHWREHPPLRLRNEVSGSGEKVSTAYCIPELTIFLACMKKTDFDEASCLSEFERYAGCCTREKARNESVKKASKEGLLGSTEERKLTKRQVNKLMAMWPQPGARNGRTTHIPPEMQYHDPLVAGRTKRGT